MGASEEIICLAHQHHSLERTDHWNLASYDCREYLLWHTSVPRPCRVDHNNQRIQRGRVWLPEKTCQNLRGRDITIHLVSVISGLGIGGFAYEDYATLVQDLVRVMGMPENRASVFERSPKGLEAFDIFSFACFGSDFGFFSEKDSH